jgi:ribonuclease Z
VRTFLHSRHPGGSLAFRIVGPGCDVVYSTDVAADAADGEFAAFARGCRLMIHEANFLEEHADLAERTGHSTARGAGGVAAAAEAGRLLLTHFNPLYGATDLERLKAEAARIFPGAELAREGAAYDCGGKP